MKLLGGGGGGGFGCEGGWRRSIYFISFSIFLITSTLLS